MNQSELIQFADDFFTKIIEKAKGKGEEYSRGGAFDNFEKAARKKGTVPEEVLSFYELKHQISIDDMIEDLKKGIHHPVEIWEEKIGDDILYRVILLAMINCNKDIGTRIAPDMNVDIEPTNYDRGCD